MSETNSSSKVIVDDGSQSFAPKVMHVLDHSLPLHSGYAFRTHSLLRCQLNRGWEPLALTSPKQEKSWQQHSDQCETIDGIRYYRTGFYSQGWFSLDTELRSIASLDRRLRRLIAKEKPHLLHVHSPVVNALPAVRVARQLGIPVVYEIRAFWEDAAVDRGTYTERSLSYKSVRAVETWVCMQVAQVVVLCQGLKQDLISRGLPDCKLHIGANGISLEEFKSSAPDEEFRSRWGLQGKVVIGFLGSFYHYEGLVLLLEVFSVLARERRDLVLLLVGGGHMESELKGQSKLLGVEDRVVFPGRISHERVPGVYALLDALIYPRCSMRLTDMVTPLKPLEAMAMKRAVVASDVGGHRELIRDGETGILFRAGDAGSLKRSLQRALDDKPLIRQLTEQAYRWVCEERQWKKTTEVYHKVYDLAFGLIDFSRNQIVLTALLVAHCLAPD
jgi:PEP-CTERM/exosortase A-associated glycosyltransferase